jgi:hypothetical protein
VLAGESEEVQQAIAEAIAKRRKADALRDLRALAKKKQDEVEGMRQDGVSRLEKRNDMLLSSLNAYVRGLGGKLKIVAELPDVGPVELEITPQSKVKGATAAAVRKAERHPRQRRSA